LERKSVLVTVGYALVSKTPVEAVITAYPHRSPLASPAEVADDYSKALSAAGLTSDEQRSGHLSYTFYHRRLQIAVKPGTVMKPTIITEGVTVPYPGWRSVETSFPRPSLVADFYGALVKMATAGGLDADLPTRRRGKVPDADNLIPACVAFLLKEYGVHPDKAINGLLVEHVLGAEWKTGRLPYEIEQFRSGDRGSSLHEQVWGNSRKKSIVREPLIDAAWTLFWEGYEE
jgi:hypothetical protein